MLSLQWYHIFRRNRVWANVGFRHATDGISSHRLVPARATMYAHCTNARLKIEVHRSRAVVAVGSSCLDIGGVYYTNAGEKKVKNQGSYQVYHPYSHCLQAVECIHSGMLRGAACTFTFVRVRTQDSWSSRNEGQGPAGARLRLFSKLAKYL